MAETIDEITYDYEEDGRLVRRQLDKNVLSKGAWSTIMFLYQELDRAKDEWRAPKIAIVRYKKWNGTYRKQSGFNISSEKQARAITEAIGNWYVEGKTYDPETGELVDAPPEPEKPAKKKPAKKAASKSKAKPKAKAKAKAKADDDDAADE